MNMIERDNHNCYESDKEQTKTAAVDAADQKCHTHIIV